MAYEMNSICALCASNVARVHCEVGSQYLMLTNPNRGGWADARPLKICEGEIILGEVVKVRTGTRKQTGQPNIIMVYNAHDFAIMRRALEEQQNAPDLGEPAEPGGGGQTRAPRPAALGLDCFALRLVVIAAYLCLVAALFPWSEFAPYAERATSAARTYLTHRAADAIALIDGIDPMWQHGKSMLEDAMAATSRHLDFAVDGIRRGVTEATFVLDAIDLFNLVYKCAMIASLQHYCPSALNLVVACLTVATVVAEAISL